MRPGPGIRYLFLILLLLIICRFSFCQSLGYTITPYTTRDGLANNNVQAVIRDTTGFLWAGTFDGLSRFDGYEFRNYFSDIHDTTSLPDIDIRKLCVDRYNNLWVLTPGTVCRYVRNTDNFKRYNPISFGKPSEGPVTCMAVDPERNLWLARATGVERYDARTDRFIPFPVVPISGRPATLAFSYFDIDNKGLFWLFGNGQLYTGRFEGKPGERDHRIRITGNIRLPDLYQQGNPNFHLQADMVSGVGCGTWLVTNNGLFRLDTAKLEFVRLTAITAEDLKGCPPLAWSEVANGIFLWMPGEGRVLHIDREEIAGAHALYRDRQVLWCGALAGNNTGTGLAMISTDRKLFTNILWEEPGLGQAAVFGLIMDTRGFIWAGSRGTDHMVRIAPDNRIERCNYITREQLLRGGHIRSMVIYNGRIRTGFLGNLVCEFDPSLPVQVLRRTPMKEITGLPEFKGIDGFRIFSTDKSGNIVAGGSGNSIWILNPSSGETLFRGTWPSAQYFYSYCCDRDSNHWFGGRGRLVMVNHYFGFSREYNVGMPYNIECITEGEGDVLWLALLGGGIARFHRNTRETKYYTINDGLPNNMTYSIVTDQTGRLWITTNRGLACFDPVNEVFRVFDASDGMGIEEFNADASGTGAGGEIFFGGMGGIIRFFPDSVISPVMTSDLRLIISGFRVSGTKLTLGRAIYESDTVRLNDNRGNIQISFTGINFRDPYETRYRYMLKGVDREWMTAGFDTRTVNYSGLSPGRYPFRLEATDENGNWSYSRTLVIIIPARFYQAVWFRVLFILLLLFLAGVLYYWNLHRIRLRELRRYNLLQVETLRGQMNPHFIFNALNSINYFISESNKMDANMYITRFSRLIRSFLDFSSFDYVPLSKELETLEEYLLLEHLRFGDRFDYRISVSPDLDAEGLQVVPTMVQPLVENAIWHGIRTLEGRKGKIRISYRKVSPGCVTCTVEDDGVGWKTGVEERKKKDRNYHPRGIDNIRQRLRLINDMRKTSFGIRIGELHPGREQPGTVITVEIPVKP